MHLTENHLRIVIIGLTITSSWGNGHAATYRGLVRELTRRGHDVLFLEHDKPWYAKNRDLPSPPYCRTAVYSSVDELRQRFSPEIGRADCVIVGSYVPEGIAVGELVLTTTVGITAFYDIDTPVTLSRLSRGSCDYLTYDLMSRYRMYLSFTGGPTLDLIENEHGSPMARPLYCSVDPELYFPEDVEEKWDLGYLGTYSPDRQPSLQQLLCDPARQWRDGRFIVAGPQYPQSIVWPDNVERVEHLAPHLRRAFYNAQRFTLNVTRADMLRAGFSPSVRLFEAAACGTPIISDYWEGLSSVFAIGTEILTAWEPHEVTYYLRELPEEMRRDLGARARDRVMREHTAAHRALELERYIDEAANNVTTMPTTASATSTVVV